MRITATKCKARELKPGDLFSTVGQYYWDHRDLFAIGASVYIRTEAPADPNADVYRIAIEPGVPQGGTIEVVPPQRTEGIPSTIEKPNTTLFGIHSQLLELYQLREDVTADPDIFPADKTQDLAAIDKAIDTYIALEAHKVDSVVVVKRQFEAAAEFNKLEAKRLQARAKRFEQEAEDIEERLIRFMQANRLTVMEGKTARLKLAKNPPSVNPRQPDLIPERFLRQDVCLSVEQWHAVERALLDWADQANEAGVDDSVFTGLARAIHDARAKSAPAPDLVPIKKEMQLPCENCKGAGRIVMSDGSQPTSIPFECEVCGGSGKRAVAGCELVTDKVRLAVS